MTKGRSKPIKGKEGHYGKVYFSSDFKESKLDIKLEDTLKMLQLAIDTLDLVLENLSKEPKYNKILDLITTHIEVACKRIRLSMVPVKDYRKQYTI